MHDRVSTQVPCPHDPSTSHQIITFLQDVIQTSQRDQAAEAPALLPSPRKRGRPELLHLDHLWLALLLAILRGLSSFADVWRLLVWQGIGSFALLSISETAVRKRLLAVGLDPLQTLLERVTTALASWTAPAQARDLAPFATEVVALDESTLDAVHRLCEDVRQEQGETPRLLVGKIAGLFDLRRQLWIRLQFRQEVFANCKTELLLLLEGLAPGSLILADLGYFSFPWFDYLTAQGYWWLSRLREGTSYRIEHVFVHQGDILDALVWLGAYRADRAGHLVRLIQFPHHNQLRQYVTNVLDPMQLSMRDAAVLYARRWDIEMAFKTLKKDLGIGLWWGCVPTLVLQQLWAALILAQVLHALHVRIAVQANVDLFDVSLPVLIRLLALAPQRFMASSLVAELVLRGKRLRLIRPSRRLQPCVPALHTPYHPAPADLLLTRSARYARRKCRPRSDRPPFLPRFSSRLLI